MQTAPFSTQPLLLMDWPYRTLPPAYLSTQATKEMFFKYPTFERFAKLDRASRIRKAGLNWTHFTVHPAETKPARELTGQHLPCLRS